MNFWMKKEFVEMWNVHGLDDDDKIESINITSNSLERCNRYMKYNIFPTHHPNLVKFTEKNVKRGTAASKED